MAFQSPGVSTTESDQSFFSAGIAGAGCAFVGPFEMGAAFLPQVVNSLSDFQSLYGGMTPSFYTPYAVNSYMQEATSATIVRVLGLTGYSSTTYQSLRLSITGSGSTFTVGLIHPSQLGVTLPTGSVTGTPINFSLTLSGSNGLKTFNSMSIDPTSPQYFATVLGQSATTPYDGFVYADFPDAATLISGSLVGSGSMTLVSATGDLNLSGSAFGAYSNAFSPVIRSQLIGGLRSNLFQILTLSDGNAANDLVKVTIANLAPPAIAGNYGTFSLLVRAIGDTDTKMSILEQFDNLNLNPDDANFVARRIGDYQPTINADGSVYLEGNYPNNSMYINIQMSVGSDTVSTNALPYGFAPLNPPLNRSDIPSPSYVDTRYYTPVGSNTPVANSNIVYGFNFTDETSLSYLNPLPSGSTLKSGFNDSGFDLLTSLATQDALDITPTSATAIRRFTVPLQGGFDGQNPAVVRNVGTAITSNNTMGFDLSSGTSDGSVGYNLAISALSDPDSFDINLIVTPGVVYSEHPYICSQVINMVQARADVLYIMDNDILNTSVSGVISDVTGIDTSYACTYHSWIKILDVSNNKNVWVPPSVLMPRVFATNDQVGSEFFAPAGLQRGGISEALQVRTRLNQADRDALYQGRVNPIALFPNQGISVWGQKTLQQEDSLLTRINVRRLLIKIKKAFSQTGKYILFDQLSQNTVQQLNGLYSSYLSQIVQQNGLYGFKIQFDTTNVDENILIGNIYLQPTPALEFLQLNFNIQNGSLSVNG